MLKLNRTRQLQLQHGPVSIETYVNATWDAFRGQIQFEAELIEATKSAISTQDMFVFKKPCKAIPKVLNPLPLLHGSHEIFIVRYGLARRSSVIDDFDKPM